MARSLRTVTRMAFVVPGPPVAAFPAASTEMVWTPTIRSPTWYTMAENRSSGGGVTVRVPSGWRTGIGLLVAATATVLGAPTAGLAPPVPVRVVRMTDPRLVAWSPMTDARVDVGLRLVTPWRNDPM